MPPEAVAPSLLRLPDPCLLLVLQFCADDQRTVFSAARTHSRLHQAVVALSSITAGLSQQQHADGLLLYLEKHGQPLDSLSLVGGAHGAVSLQQLPSNLQLTTLQFEQVTLQLSSMQFGVQQWWHNPNAANDFPGVFGNAWTPALKQLRLKDCNLTDGYRGLASALPTGLEHLSLNRVYPPGNSDAEFPSQVLQPLKQLTDLELVGMDAVGPSRHNPSWAPLKDLTRLAHLRLDRDAAFLVSASNFSGLCQLTYLNLASCAFEAGYLAGKTKLQHLDLCCVWCQGEAVEEAHLLSHGQQMQQLTHMRLYGSVTQTVAAANGTYNPPAAAFSALTASTNLRHLDISGCKLPAGVWEHVFPIGRQLPNLTSLNVMFIMQPSSGGYAYIYAPAPESSRLAGCCPSLEVINTNNRWERFS